jgi:RimJ/RimL family protein N-acetyltransferase
MNELESERLLLRPMSHEDLDWFAVLRGDAAVMRYLGAGRPMTRAESVEKLARYVECWNAHGLGMFSVRSRQSPAPIGWGGLQPLDDTAEVEVGYAFAREAWGRGYATELSRAVMRWGFDTRGLARIVAVADPGNDASRHVMEKLGMHYEGIRIAHELDSVYYSITAADFARAESLRSGSDA